MSGSITSRKLSKKFGGRLVWDGRIDVPTSDGKRKRRIFRGLPSRRAAEQKLAEVMREIERGTFVASSSMTLAEYLEEWIGTVRATLRTSTWDSYKSEIKGHIARDLGHVRLQKLTAAQLNHFYAKELTGDEGQRPPLSRRTTQYHHTIIRKALSDAVKWNLLARNVGDSASPPKQRSPEMQTWSAEELRTFLVSVKDDRLYAAWLLEATTGMRRGEILGLPWPDLDLEERRLSIRQTLLSIRYELHFSEPKTRKSRRQVTLDAGTTTALREHRKRQIEEGLARGSAHPAGDLVFTRVEGTPIHPQWFSTRFKRLAKRAGLPVIRFQDLRHTYATLALAAGVHPKVVSERLGHASVTITLDTYSHVVPTLQREAADVVAALILGG